MVFFLGAKNVNMDDEEWRNPHCVATVLKAYLNELPTCLFTEEKYFSFVKMFRGKSFCWQCVATVPILRPI